MTTPLLVEDRGPVRILTLNRPEQLNAMDSDLYTRLIDALKAAQADDAVRVVVLRGAGTSFCSGADTREFSSLTPDQSERVEYRAGLTYGLHKTIPEMGKPVIAAVHGYAVGGGCGLALACDIAIAGESAKFGVPEVKLGAIPGAGGTQRLIHAIGKSKAMALLLTGDFIDARKACDFGIVAEVTADGQALPTALAMASRIAANSPLAVVLAKDAALASFETPLAQGLEHEKRNFFVVLRSADNLEGQAAFLGKRAPNFTGH